MEVSREALQQLKHHIEELKTALTQLRMLNQQANHVIHQTQSAVHRGTSDQYWQGKKKEHFMNEFERTTQQGTVLLQTIDEQIQLVQNSIQYLIQKESQLAHQIEEKEQREKKERLKMMKGD
ncbi:flagellar biosynthesis chaperone FliJ [Scopulibacillus daqui]|uniref:Flagellar biosynthesis chaperone FliJ n=1 Tax=Scopulibacillus daqui TaxID=1469162 RepID=A0ABS2Q015_9BACL|nr:hypothetical protein [Scopulibacillus daqui]MBM7645471.1 flagellar biosynthesis chaperone FliJ [Scopulibacillus daqui]